MMIAPNMQQAYDWRFEDGTDSATVSFVFPETFNIHCLTIELLYDNEVLSVTAPGGPLLCYGTLFEPVSSIDKVLDEDACKVTVTLHKTEAKPWPLLIRTFCVETHAIDAKSAYILWDVLTRSDASQEIKVQASELLQNAAQTGFLPALKTLGNILVMSGPELRNEGLRLIQVAANTYQDADSMCQLGTVLAVMPDSHEAGVSMIKQAAELGCVDAYINLGQVASPACESQGDKNARVALEYFEKYEAAAKDPNPIVYYELAKLYEYGFEGVAQDKERAAELYQKAVRGFAENGEEAPPLEMPKSAQQGAPRSLLVGGIAVATLSLFCFAVFKHVWRQGRK